MLKLFNKHKKKLPDYWLDYTAALQGKNPVEIQDTTFIVLDTETTGFDYKTDRILCIGAVTLKNNIIDVSNTFEVYIKQEKFNPESVKIHGLLHNENFETISEEQAIEKFLRYAGNSVIVAHHAYFDITMIDNAMKRLGLPGLKNKVLDTGVLYRASRITSNLIDKEKRYTLDEIAETLSIDVSDRHTAAGDAFITAIAFLKICNRLNKNLDLKLKDLFKF
ncbi:3'-5' exonuclease [Abyssalbus ytuae]|uniref:3'-5' exonuclease n=1 Tax=Abyssalbus ytuae TaxID=2926907 RepID=A0A9E6ZMV6_9FLAO|nr:3'-5' exonuclease [Abyssalbus ytuae]UOB17190.1 3'-5' exonuclease [Abyssalbus ytuae]